MHTDIDAELARFETEERARLGLTDGPGAERWTDESNEAQGTRNE